MKNIFLKTAIVVSYVILVSACSSEPQQKAPAVVEPYKPKYDTLANALTKAGDIDLFHRMDYRLVDSIWSNGKNESGLMEIVMQRHYSDLARLMASEILFHSKKDYPSKELLDTLAYVYARALYITGDTKNYPLMGNEWGFMYYTDKDSIKDYEIIGSHLMLTGIKVVPYLMNLLNDTNIIVYWGSQEATLGNSLRYRVKDAAAFYISKIKHIPVHFYDDFSKRDAEVKRLYEELH
jgi:hypothetical protein